MRRHRRAIRNKNPRWWFVHAMGCVVCDPSIRKEMRVAKAKVWPQMGAKERSRIYSLDWGQP